MDNKTIRIVINKFMAQEIISEITTSIKERMKGDEAILGEEWLDGYVSGYHDLLNILEVKTEDLNKLLNIKEEN